MHATHAPNNGVQVPTGQSTPLYRQEWLEFIRHIGFHRAQLEYPDQVNALYPHGGYLAPINLSESGSPYVVDPAPLNSGESVVAVPLGGDRPRRRSPEKDTRRRDDSHERRRRDDERRREDDRSRDDRRKEDDRKRHSDRDRKRDDDHKREGDSHKRDDRRRDEDRHRSDKRRVESRDKRRREERGKRSRSEDRKAE